MTAQRAARPRHTTRFRGTVLGPALGPVLGSVLVMVLAGCGGTGVSATPSPAASSPSSPSTPSSLSTSGPSTSGPSTAGPSPASGPSSPTSSSTGTADGTPSSPGAIPTSVPPRTASSRPLVVLTDGAVAGVATGGDGRRAEAVLRAALGAPTKVEELPTTCELGPYPPARVLHWNHLAVTLERRPALVVRGWRVADGAAPDGVRLPYGIGVGTPVRTALATVPKAKGAWDDTFGIYMVTTPVAPHLNWFGPKANGSGTVTEVTNDFSPCE